MSWEPGYVLLNDLFYSVSQNYSLFLITCAIIIYSLFLRSIYQYTKYPLITALCYHSMFLGYMGMNRQLIAVAICLFAFRYIVSRESFKFLFCVTIASLFHVSAWCFILVYFLNRQMPRYFYVAAIITAFILNPIAATLIDHILSIAPSRIQYFVSSKIGLLSYTGEKILTTVTSHNSIINVALGVAKRTIIFLPLYLNLYKLKRKVPNIELMLNIYFISIIFYILFNNTVLQILVSKGSIYFGLFEMFLLPFFFYLFKKDNAVLVYFIIIVFVFITFSRYLYFTSWVFVPYTGIFIDSEIVKGNIRIFN